MTDLDALLGEASATERMKEAGINAAATPTYVRHKPGETTIIAYQFDLDSGTRTYGYAQWCQDPARADQIFAKARTLRPRPSLISDGLDRLDANTVLYSFPNDARLRRLRWYGDTRKIKRSLAGLVDSSDCISRTETTVEVLRYKPERRVVNHVGLRTKAGTSNDFLVRYTTKPHAKQLQHCAAHLRSSGVNVPAPVACLEEGTVSVDEFIDGQQLREAVIAGSACAEAVADAVVAFHAAPMPMNVPRRTRVQEFERSAKGLKGLAQWRESLAAIAVHTERVLSRTCPAEPSRTRLLHGDLHTKNVLQTGHGVSFVDLERMTGGDPAIDLGYFLAHGLARPIRDPNELPGAADFAQSVIHHYRRRSNSLTEASLAWQTAIGLVDQALLVARHLEANWPTTVQQLLETACTAVNRPRTHTRTPTP